MYLPFICKIPIVLGLCKIVTLNFPMYILRILICSLKTNFTTVFAQKIEFIVTVYFVNGTQNVSHGGPRKAVKVLRFETF